MSIVLAVWIARTLSRNGRAFLTDAVNRLLVLGLMGLSHVYVLDRTRRRGQMEREQVPPVPPQDWVRV